MSDTLVKDIQNAVETAYAEILKNNPSAKLDRKMLYNDKFVENVNASIEKLIDLAVPHLKGTDLVKMWVNCTYSMGDMKGYNNRAFRIVNAWVRLVEHNKMPFDEGDYLKYIKTGVRPATKVEPSKSEPKPKVPKSEPVPEPETQPDPPAEVREGVEGAMFDSETLMEFYEDEPEVIIQTVPAESSEESEPEPTAQNADVWADFVPIGISREEFDRRWALSGPELAKDFERVTGNHSKFAQRAIVKCRHRLVYLWGLAGLGKSRIPKDIASYYGFPVYVISAVSMPELLWGTPDFQGNLIPTSLTIALSKPCMVIFEEVDRWVRSVKNALQPLLADRVYTLPNGETRTQHPGCIIMGNGNTNMIDRSALFPGIEPSDYAFVDRWRHIHVQYESKIAREIAGKDYAYVVDFLEDFNRARTTCNIARGEATYRPLERIVEDIKSDDGDTLEDILMDNLIKGMFDKDVIGKIVSNMKDQDSELAQALKRCKP
jgi:hypothetical protein